MEDLMTSALAVGHNHVEHVETSTLDRLASESMATEWTDEKHSLYLKSMEASFVSQLYSSTDFLGRRSQEDYSSNPKFYAHNPSGQFKVLKNGCWETVSHRRNKLRVNKADRSNILTANPWIRHFRSGSKHQIVTSSDLQEKAALTTTISTCLPVPHTNTDHQDLVEMTDQNFVDEEVVREKPNRKCSTKRIKTDQVVAENNVSPNT